MGQWGDIEKRNLMVRNRAQNETVIEQNAQIIALLQHQNEVLDWLAQQVHRQPDAEESPTV